MQILSRIRVRAKLALLLGVTVLAMATSIGIAASILKQRMMDDRVDKLRAIVQTAIGQTQSLEDQVVAHQLTREQALEQLRKAAHSMRFDAGDGYIYAQTLDNRFVVHGANPSLEDTQSQVKDTSGRSLTSLIVAALRSGDDGVVAYDFVKPGQARPQPKVAYIARFAPWGLVFGAGAYTEDLEASFHAIVWKLSSVAAAILFVSLLVAWVINRDIVGSLGRLNAVMGRLSRGDLEAAIPGTDRRDEVGSMANALLVFKQELKKAEELRAEQEAERARAQAARVESMVAMAETIEAEARNAMTEVGERTTAMAQAASSMSGSASRTGVSAESAAAAAAQALANAQMVASAAEELSTSIREIGSQVNQSAQVVSRAVAAGRATRETIEALNEQVSSIGRVTDMIGDIAAKTNLLALNATIEAARAGEAGKGFAVVASEVKQLATQTARSTDEISRHIAEVRHATTASVAAVDRIENTISEVNAIAGSIAAAVEQQSAATGEIARNITETATAANLMAGRTTEVSGEAAKTGEDAALVLQNSNALHETIGGLQRALLRVVRTSSSDVDRRQGRRRPCHVEAAIIHGGVSDAAILHDLSEHGCRAVSEAHCEVGQDIEIALQGNRLRGCVVARSAEGPRDIM